MTDNTQPEAGSTYIIRYALELGLLWIDGDGRNKVREALNALDALEAKLASIAASPTPPAEQQATKETSGGFHVWRDISTAPKDGSRFVATGYNYGLYSEGRHICVAQWFRGCWMETSDWNEASELTHLTHWLPLPSPPDDVAAPAEQQSAPKAAPGEPTDSDGFGSAEHWKEKAQYWAGVAHRLRGEALRGEPVDGIVQPPAPQQEAQEPATIDQKTMELAESVGLIGPASRVGDLHAAIQRFHDLICVNATIKAAVMVADVIRGVATPARDYPPLPMQFACSGMFPVYSAEQMRNYVDADRAALAARKGTP